MLTWHDHLQLKYGEFSYHSNVDIWQAPIEQMALDMASLG